MVARPPAPVRYASSVASQIVVYGAISLDGYLAESDGSVGFLSPFDGEDYGYHAFFASIGGLVMGATTYEQVLGFGWPYGDLPVLVLSHRDLEIPSGVNATISSGDIADAIGRFADVVEKGVWIVGGGVVITDALAAGLVDCLDLSVMPVLLGSGIPLVNEPIHRSFRLSETFTYENGVARLVYSPEPSR